MLAFVRKAESHQRKGNNKAADDSQGALFSNGNAHSDETGGYANG